MSNKKTFKNLFLLGTAMMIASSIASILNIGPILPAINVTGASTLLEAILGKIIFSMQIGAWIYLTTLLIQYRNVTKAQIGSCILIIHSLGMILNGENLFFLLSCIYCTILTCMYSRTEFSK